LYNTLTLGTEVSGTRFGLKMCHCVLPVPFRCVTKHALGAMYDGKLVMGVNVCVGVTVELGKGVTVAEDVIVAVGVADKTNASVTVGDGVAVGVGGGVSVGKSSALAAKTARINTKITTKLRAGL
jgi:hypothetical protein